MHTPANLLFWILFLAFVVLMLGLDLGIVRRDARAIGLREALLWTALWVGLAAGFAVLLYFHGQRMTGEPLAANSRLSLEFLTAYLVEESLSVDNLFLFLLIFRYFKVPSELQHKVLFWGIFGAILMRALFIGTGLVLLNRFTWVNYVFGVIIVFSGFKLLFENEQEKNPGENFLTRFAQRHLRMTNDYSGGNFTVRRNGALWFTTLAMVLVVVETTDLIFAVDSIPAVLAVTRQPYVVFTSNVFAILGLRAIYFALASLMELFHYLHYGLAAILVLIGVKMLGARYFEIPTLYTLGLTVAALAICILLSMARRPREQSGQ